MAETPAPAEQFAPREREMAIIANPAPLGLGGFALTTFVLSLFNAGVLDEKGEPVVLGLALAYGGGAQLLAGMWEFRTGNTFGATAFTSYGAFWISFYLLVVFFAPQLGAAAGEAIGWYLIAWGIFTGYMFIASLRTSAAVALVFILLAATYIVLGIGETSATTGISRLGGWLGILTAIAAWYASFAEVTNATWDRQVLPTKPLAGR
jgi:succinate-acetate transporter protein